MPNKKNPRPQPPHNVQTNWYWSAPYFAVLIFALAMLVLVWVLQRQESETQRNALARDVQWAEQTMRLHMQGTEDFLGQLARELAGGTLDGDGFQVRANQHIANNPELVNVVWIAADQRVKWTAPFDTTDWLVGDALSRVQSEVASRARSLGRPVYGEAYVNARNMAVLEVYMPVQQGRQPLGAVVAVYSIERMVAHLVPSWFGEKYRLAFVGVRGEVLGANSSARPVDESLDFAVPLDPPGNGLGLQATAYHVESELPKGLPIAVIVALSFFVLWSLWLLRAHTLRRVRVEKERDRLFNLSLDMLAILGHDGVFRRCNPAFERILGHSPESLPGRPLLDFIHPDDVADAIVHLRSLASGTPGAFENRCRCADGSYRWLAWSVNSVPEERLMYAVAHDITGRKAAEEALHDEYAFRKSMEESLVTGLRAIDLSGRITYVNQAFCRMTGWSRDELVGSVPPFPYWPRDEVESLQRNLELTLSGNAPSTGFEMRVRRKDGSRLDARFYLSPLIDGEGRQIGWMASITDITEPKRVRAELEAAHERFVAILDGLDAAVYVADAASDEILFANRAFKSIYGFDAVGRRVGTYGLPTPPDTLWYDVDPRRLAPEQLPRELYDGELQNDLSGRWYHIRERATRWVDGRVVRMAIATDITDRKRVDEENRAQQERLQRTSRLITMGEMASTLAHELNQPLAAIANYSAGCVNRLQSGEYRQEDILTAMQKASAQAERAGKIIRRVREFVKKSEPRRHAVQLAGIVEDAIGFVEIDARRHGALVESRLPADLPPVFADAVMIEQVVLNLVKNGIEAMRETPADERLLVVSARRIEHGQVEVSVADRGHGLSDEAREKLFSPFYTTKAEGMGMGLNICRSIVEFHDGRLWVDANPAGGCIFRFTLPLETPRESAPLDA
ncbi:PAS domain S-box protein [Zoogloea sp.]|uniref:PAS domain-containing sensor histidine kinase n=1 Tax=Zoogloea sp. TaxID=49181 RepID=UPI0035AF65D0